MNKYTLFSLLLILLFSCNRDRDPFFDKTPEERIIEKYNEYYQMLTKGDGLWKMTMFPEEGGFSYFVKFSENSEVEMWSDFSFVEDKSMEVSQKTNFRIQAHQTLTLTFDTYIYLHELSDPDNFGTPNAYNADISFAFLRVAGDTIFCEGTKKHKEMFLVKVSPEELPLHKKTLLSTHCITDSLTLYKKEFEIDGNLFDIKISSFPRVLSIGYTDNGVSKKHNSGYYFDGDKIVLLNPFSFGSVKIADLQDITYNRSKNIVNLKIGGKDIIISQAVPKADIKAAKEFFSEKGFYVAKEGFTYQGISDYYGLTKFYNFVQLQLYNLYFDGGQYGGLLIYPDWPGYAIYADEDELEKGYVKFVGLGWFDKPESNIYNAYLSNLLVVLSNRFVVVKTSPSTFDLVSENGKYWLSFR